MERERRTSMAPVRQALVELFVGPAPEERARGVIETIPLQTRGTRVRVSSGTAAVYLAGKAPDFGGAAAIVYSLTELPGIERVRLLLDGAPCCVHRHDGSPILVVDRRTFRYWPGEPCHLRTSPTHARCRG